MKISCPTCQAKYSIADEKVTDRLAKIRCRKCGANIVIDGKVNPPNVYTSAGEGPEAAADASTTQYSVDFGEGDQRSLSVPEITAAYNAGQVTAETFVWADGFADWKPLGEVDEIVEALNAPARPSSPSPWAAPAAAAPRAAARGRAGAGADLFGRIESAGSEEEVTTSAPEGAFGGGGGGGGGASAAAAGNTTGARNESSVLFSLSALTSASSPSVSRASSRPASSATNRDDSGLIDLKALTAAATKSEAAAAPIAAPMMASPLGMAPPLGLASPLGSALASAAEPMPGQKSKTPLILGICAIIAAVVVALAILLKPPPPPPPPPIVVTQQAPAPAPTPTPEPVVTAAPTATADATDKKATAGHKAVGGGGGAKKASGGSAAPAGGGGDSAPAPPPKKKSSCGCAPSDLMCNMQCSAK